MIQARDSQRFKILLVLWRETPTSADKALQHDLGGKNIMLLRKHGTLALGAIIAEAFMRIYFIEHACAMQVATLSASGGEIYPTEDSVQDKVAGQCRDEEIARQGANLLAWPALLRRLGRLDPSYQLMDNSVS